jgi:alpha-1,3-rhamnosyl/mannosyltransferase
MQAYCDLPAVLRQRWPLLLVGGWGWKTEEVAEFYHSRARHKGVIHVGYVAEEHVAAVYNGARALVSPTLYEGFGMPPVEMLACGGAVLASRIGPHAETLGAHACLVAPEDIGGWRDAMRRVLTDDDWWRGLREGGEEAARPFTWGRCAADTLRVYHAVAGEPAPDIIIPRRKAG